MTVIPASFLKVCNFQSSKVSSFRLTLTAAIEVRSRDVKAWVNRSVALQHLGTVEEALDSIERALAIEPTDQDAQDIRAQLMEVRIE